MSTMQSPSGFTSCGRGGKNERERDERQIAHEHIDPFADILGLHVTDIEVLAGNDTRGSERSFHTSWFVPTSKAKTFFAPR